MTVSSGRFDEHALVFDGQISLSRHPPKLRAFSISAPSGRLFHLAQKHTLTRDTQRVDAEDLDEGRGDGLRHGQIACRFRASNARSGLKSLISNSLRILVTYAIDQNRLS